MADGTFAEVTGKTSSMQPPYEIGQVMRVYCDASRPNKGAIVDDFWQRWFPVSIVTLLAVACMGFGIVLHLGDRGVARSGERPTIVSSYAQRRRHRSRQMLLIGAIPIVLGSGFLFGAAASVVHEISIIKNFVRTTGTVVSIQERERPYEAHSHMFSAVVVFKTDAGGDVTFVQGSSSLHNGLREGQTVNVLYDKGTPETAMIDSFGEHWGTAAILIAIGLPLFAAGLFILITVGSSAESRRRR
ncbi:DUF3592 domain-containing protein [Trinickia violacea]